MSIAPARLILGPADHGRALPLADFIAAEWIEGCLYELSRGVVDVTQVPGLPHGRIVRQIMLMFARYEFDHPGVIDYSSGGDGSRIRTPWMASDRHPDQAVYLAPPPEGPGQVWSRWVPAIAVEVVSRGREDRDFVLKREEYRSLGVGEYWIFDRFARAMQVDRRGGDGSWETNILAPGEAHRTPILPGLLVDVAAILGDDGGAGADEPDDD